VVDHIPVISTFSGPVKVVVGLIHSIAHLAAAIFDRAHWANHIEEAKLGAKNIVRGAVATVPLIGNFMIIQYDISRQRAYIRKIKFEENCAVLYECGKKVARVSATEYYQKLRENPTPRALLDFMRGQSSVVDRPFGGIHTIKKANFSMYGKSEKGDSQIIGIMRSGGSYIDVALAKEPAAL
jgi:hypothetical protein